MKDEFIIPEALLQLVEEGTWPQNDEELRRQNLQPLISKETVQSFAPDEDGLYLYSYPFTTIEEERKKNKYWNDERNALEEIDPKKSLIIADFGIGSDTAIILDYRSSEPELLRLHWGKDKNHWIRVGLSPEEFANLIRKNQDEPGSSYNSGQSLRD